MKTILSQRLLDICSENNDLETFTKNDLNQNQIDQIESELKEHFKFDKIIWMNYPVDKTEDGSTITAQTIKLPHPDDSNPNKTYPSKIGYIYSLSFTPTMYNPKELYEPVKDGCVFAPTIYNPNTFEPTKSITLSWSPEFPQDINAPERTYEDDKQMIRDMLEKVLNNPEEYKPKGHRGCLLRFTVV
jgi:hypothetical protein